jgi:hypothetical protein
MIRAAVLAVILAACSTATGAPTPVADLRFNPAVTQDTIAETICVPGWTATVRPSTSYTQPIKRQLIAALPATADHDMADYELDHWVPLAVGGEPAARVNLVLQLWPEAHRKDVVEARVHRRVCAGVLTLEQGRACFVIDWTRC